MTLTTIESPWYAALLIVVSIFVGYCGGVIDTTERYDKVCAEQQAGPK